MKLDNFEKDILESVEANEWQSKGNIQKRQEELRYYINNDKKKAISVRINENDIYELKKKALANNIPYQNIIQVLIHQFVTNKITITM